MVSSTLKFRFKAFATHLLLSAMVAMVGLYIVFFIWHPAPLAKAVGVTDIFIMMLAIDVILGPLLTFAVAKPNKKSLKFDLAVIGIIQLSALLYGIYNISVNRPVFIAFDTKRFELVQAGDVPKSSLEKAEPEYDSLTYGKPLWVAVRPYKDANEQQQRILMEVGDGIAPSMQPDLYEPIEAQWQKILEKSQTLEDLENYNDEAKIKDILSNHPDAIGYLPLKAYNENMTVLINDNEVIDIVDLRPW